VLFKIPLTKEVASLYKNMDLKVNF
ncbi:hypothetical protein cje140_03374, partial [Campylobacter jejuni subsp. jejuni LMG 9217]